MKQTRGPVERALAHDRMIVTGAVVLVVLLAGVYTIAGVGMSMSAIDMTGMAGRIGAPMQMGAAPAWTLVQALLVFLMWWVMMVAMMTPSAAPMLLLYTALKRRGAEAARAAPLSLMLLLGYLLSWAGFSAAATALQWVAETTGVSGGAMMTLNSQALAGGVLIAAGLYQFSSLKTACLQHCRSPAHYLARHGRGGPWGALRTGLHHGAYCLGCCWALMLLLFVGGIMNLYWIVGIALYVLAEKTLPYPKALSRLTGAALLAAGVWHIAQALLA